MSQTTTDAEPITLQTDVPLRFFPITVPIMSFQFENLYRPLPEEEYSTEESVSDNFSLRFSLSSAKETLEYMQSRRWVGSDWYKLAREAVELSLITDEGDLMSLSNLRDRWRKAGVIPYRHQIETALQVIRDMDGRAILADEVGLGKTIEACLVIKEFMLRGTARRVLILTPASLRWQWYNELKDKFGIAATLQRSEYDWERSEVIIASIDTAKKSPHCDIVCGLSYDLVVVDEAHKLKNARTRNWQFVDKLRKKYFLLLTATPLQNDMEELFNLITLLKPGQLGTYSQFLERYVEDKRMPRDADALRKLLGQVMVRNRRGEGTVEFTRRKVVSENIDFTPPERTLYTSISHLRKALRQNGDTSSALNPLTLLTLQREVCSTPVAAAVTLQNILQKTENQAFQKALQQLLDMALACQVCSKADKLVDIVKQTGDKVLVFTEYRASQQYLRWRLEQEGLMVLGFDGSLSASRKEWTRELFRRHGDVLVSTESGGEGLNFQFACHIINYDLPWNPMRVEQRIGRVHRLGQNRDVTVHNIATTDTVEEHILYLLHEKINMFSLVIGELDVILAQLGSGKGFERQLYEIIAESEDDPETLRRRLDELAKAFSSAKDKANEQRSYADRLLTW